MKTKHLLYIVIPIFIFTLVTGAQLDINVQKPQFVSNSGFHDNWSDEDMLREMQLTILSDTLLEKEHKKDKTVKYYHSEVSYETEKLLKNKILKKIRGKNIAFIRYPFLAMFSRCPSGYHVEIIKKNGQLTNEGWMSASWGCATDIISKFRYDVSTGKVEAKVSDRVGYIPMDEFVKLYKEAKRNLLRSS